MKKINKQKRVSELLRLYIKKRPLLNQMIKSGIINYSSLARKMCIEIFGNIKSLNAMKMALVRFSKKKDIETENIEEKIRAILSKTTTSIRNKISIIITSKEIPNLKYLSYAESKGIITYIIDSKYLKDIENEKVIKIEKNATLFTLHSPPQIEATAGVISYILEGLSSEGINVLEFVSCYTDTLFVIPDTDTKNAYELLSFLTSE